MMYSLILSAKMNDVDTQAWLEHVLAKIAQPGQPAGRLAPLEFQETGCQTCCMKTTGKAPIIKPAAKKRPAAKAASSSAFDSFNEICTVRIELLHTNPLIWREV